MTELQIDDWGILKLVGDVSIFTVQELHPLLLTVSPDDYPELKIDLSGLTDLDTVGVQLLLGFRRRFRHSIVHSCPAQLREFVQQIGLDELFL